MIKTNSDSLTEKADAVKRDLREVTNDAVERAEEFGSDAARGVRRFKEEATQAARQASDKVSAAYERSADTANIAYRGARKYARQNPALTAAITFASGIGIGLLLAPRRTPNTFRSLRQGIIPAAAIALAHAVLQSFEESRA